MSRGFILVEVSIAYVLLTVALVALLPVFIIAIRAGKSTEQLQVATYLSQELLEEVRMRKWDQASSATPSHVVTATAAGLDAGETATNKITFNDVDDFNGWTEAPPRDPLNNALPAFSAYTRSVTVQYVDSSMVAVSTSPAVLTDYKKVTVCTTAAKLSSAGICLSTLLTNR